MTDHPVDDRDKPTCDWKRPPEPLIHRAARKGDLDTLAALVEGGADINETADLEFDNGPHLDGLTALMVAARSIDGASVETLRWLVDHGADIHARSDGGNTAAWYAAGHGGRWEFHEKAVTPDHAERLRYLLDLGLDAHERNFIGRSLISEACEAGDPARVRLLLDRGAPAVVSGTGARRPLLMERIQSALAEDSGLADDVPTGDVDSFQIPLFCTARSGSVECVEMILEAGADPSTRDSSGNTALMVAGSVDVVRTLLDAGTDLHAIDVFGKDALETVLEGSCESGACETERFDIARALVDAGADVERVDRFGKTRLASAAFGHHADAVEFLLKLGADANALDSEGGTALHSICWQGEYEDEETNQACERIIRALVGAGVPVNAVDADGSTAMHQAAGGDWGNQTAIRVLLELGADPDVPDDDGDTPLMLASGHGETACIRMLLEAGADPRAKNKAGQTAIDAAREHLDAWETIAAAGPEESLDAMMREMERDIAKELADEFGCEPPDEVDSDDSRSAGPQENALRDARASLELLLSAASGTS